MFQIKIISICACLQPRQLVLVRPTFQPTIWSYKKHNHSHWHLEYDWNEDKGAAATLSCTKSENKARVIIPNETMMQRDCRIKLNVKFFPDFFVCSIGRINSDKQVKQAATFKLLG